MTNYIDPHLPDDQIAGQDKKQIHRDKDRATEFDRDLLFPGESTYNRDGKPMSDLEMRNFIHRKRYSK